MAYFHPTTFTTELPPGMVATASAPKTGKAEAPPIDWSLVKVAAKANTKEEIDRAELIRKIKAGEISNEPRELSDAQRGIAEKIAASLYKK